jgi:hypothetical protein
MKYYAFQELMDLWGLSREQVFRIVKSGEYQGEKLTIKYEKLPTGGLPRRLVLWHASETVFLESSLKGFKDGFFIDKLNVKQTHQANDLRLVGKQACYYVDLQTGETKETPYITHLQHEGSYSSSLTVRCDGSTVEVYGNPSRYGRMDNLFGYRSIDECFDFYNSILEKLGLPPFTKCTEYLFFQGKEGSRASKTSDGALISHIDVTRNWSVGSGNERAYLKALSSQSIGRSVPPFLYPDENTVDWYGSNMQKNGSTFRYIKVYNKFQDLLRHQFKILKWADSASFAYYRQLLDFCSDNGVLREEHSFKRPLLKKLNCFAWGLFSESDLQSHLESITNIRERLEASKIEHETIADRLIEAGICKSGQSANATQNYYSMWLHGQELDKHKRQFKLHKSRLLQIGFDISVKPDISRYSPTNVKSITSIVVKVIQSPPDWYVLPKNLILCT